MHTSPRRPPCKMNYLESDSSDKEKSNKNASSDDQEREESVETLANARSLIGALESDKSMKEDKDELIKEKQEDSSFVQTTTMTQADFHDGDSLSSQASSVLSEITAASSEVTCLRTLQNTVNRTPCMSNKNQTRGKERKRTQRRRKVPLLKQ